MLMFGCVLAHSAQKLPEDPSLYLHVLNKLLVCQIQRAEAHEHEHDKRMLQFHSK